MTPDPHASIPSTTTFLEPSDLPARLQLKTGAVGVGDLDGAWWPRSRELAAELPVLFAVLAARWGSIALVAYHLDDWDEAPGGLAWDGGVVELDGFRGSPHGQHTVTVVAVDGQGIALLLVSPTAAEGAAHEALAAATRPDPTEASHAAAEVITRGLDDVVTGLIRREGPGDGHRTADIRDWVAEAAAMFADAPIQTYVPVLVEHIVRRRLAATVTP
jgi:hypothetical protein